MRHLIVPSAETQHWLNALKSKDWLLQGVGVISLDGGLKGIPINELAPSGDDKIWQGHPQQAITREEVKISHWSDYLNRDLHKKIGQFLPRSYEMIGDILIVRLEDKLLPYQKAIAKAMLKRISSARIVCADNGVEGDFRVRKLTPITSRDGNLSTLTTIRENGQMILIDPTKAYFSSRLSTERLGTATAVKKLSKLLERPLSVFDPYAGVGPAFANLFKEPNLLSELYAGDLNPHAVDLLRQNIANFSTKNHSRLKVCEIKCLDARRWRHDKGLIGKADVLLVNLPHDIIAHLPTLIPLLKTEQTTLIRAWAIINKKQLENLNSTISAILSHQGAQDLKINCQEIKGFSATKSFVRIECWQNLA